MHRSRMNEHAFAYSLRNEDKDRRPFGINLQKKAARTMMLQDMLALTMQKIEIRSLPVEAS